MTIIIVHDKRKYDSEKFMGGKEATLVHLVVIQSFRDFSCAMFNVHVSMEYTINMCAFIRNTLYVRWQAKAAMMMTIDINDAMSSTSIMMPLLYLSSTYLARVMLNS